MFRYCCFFFITYLVNIMSGIQSVWSTFATKSRGISTSSTTNPCIASNVWLIFFIHFTMLRSGHTFATVPFYGHLYSLTLYSPFFRCHRYRNFIFI
uniref:Uncharacterized protein n=1 Tax=Panstrongylus lignarius TaxID=156445 RepID=A0A224XR59_9HEMI